MTEQADAARIAAAVSQVAAAIGALEEAGRGIPTVEKNAKRLKGTLYALEIQFQDLLTAAGAEHGTR